MAGAGLLGCGAESGAQVGTPNEVALANADGGTGEACEHGDQFAGHDRFDGRGHGKGRGGKFARWDANGDGKLALTELPEPAKEHFAGADLNSDGFLEKDEMKAAFKKRREEHMKQADTDGNGELSKEEREAAFRARGEERFKKVDANADGALTSDEVPAKRWEYLKAADANTDGKITREEIEAGMKSGALRPPRWGHGGKRGGPGHGPGGGPGFGPEGDDFEGPPDGEGPNE